MIATQLYKGQGFGNQLWVYAVTRAIAERNGYEFSIAGKEYFKGNKFLNLNFGKDIEIELNEGPVHRIPLGFTNYYKEIKTVHPIYNCDISKFDPYLYNIPDNTFIDGNMQTEKYIFDFREKIQSWFSVPTQFFDGCTIHFRGTEYRGLQDVLLPISYFHNAINYLRLKYGEIKFRVVTDDFELATKYFPDFPIMGRSKFRENLSSKLIPVKTRLNVGPNQKSIRRDFASIQNSKFLIIPNSSFSWWGAWTNQEVVEVVAPKYWARHNISDGFWSTGDIKTEGWTWLDRHNNISR